MFGMVHPNFFENTLVMWILPLGAQDGDRILSARLFYNNKINKPNKCNHLDLGQMHAIHLNVAKDQIPESLL